MVKVLMSDLLKSNAQTVVNTVNCVGIMGKGIALKFKEQFPDMFDDYVARCNRNEVRLGKPLPEARGIKSLFLTNDPDHNIGRLSRI